MAVGNRHIFINLNDNLLCGFDNAPHIGYLRSEIEVAVTVHRRYLKERNVDFVLVIIPIIWQLIE